MMKELQQTPDQPLLQYVAMQLSQSSIADEIRSHHALNDFVVADESATFLDKRALMQQFVQQYVEVYHGN